MSNLKMGTAQRITQHKRFALRAHLNPAFGGTSFMLEPLCANAKPERGKC